MSLSLALITFSSSQPLYIVFETINASLGVVVKYEFHVFLTILDKIRN